MVSPLIVLSALALTLTGATAQRCAGSDGGGDGSRGNVIVDITSRRNSTGHRHLKADLSVREKLGAGDVGFRLENRADVTHGIRYVHLSAYISAPEPRVPPPGYELAPGLGWYRLHLDPLTWEEARLACEAEGAHLAVPNSPEEAAALKGIFAKAPDSITGASWRSLALIGFSDPVEGRYVTIFGDTLEDAGYAEWDNGQPNNSKTSIDAESDCGAISRNGKLNDVQCREKGVYFCEYPL